MCWWMEYSKNILYVRQVTSSTSDRATIERQIDAMQPEQVCEGLWIRVVLIKEVSNRDGALF